MEAVRLRAEPIREISAISASDSQLKLWIPSSSAYRISSAVLPTPEKTTELAFAPAANTRYNSPPETISNPAPASASAAKTATLEFDLTAKQTLCGMPRRADSYRRNRLRMACFEYT